MNKSNIKKMTVTIFTHFQSVGEFHRVFDYPVRTQPYFSVFDAEPKLIASRICFLREERDEFIVAFRAKDLVEMADALCDLIYFAFGTGQCLGFDMDSMLRSRNKSDITKTPSISTEVDPQIVGRCKSEIQSKLDEITRLIDQFETDCASGYFWTAGEHLVELTERTYELGYYLNFDMDAMFREVHRSNMTKVCESEAEAQESVKRYLENGVYEQPVVRTKGDYFLVYDEALNKILKNYKWEEPNLRQFMGPAYADK